MSLRLADSYTEILDNELRLAKDEARRRLNQAMLELHEAAGFERTLGTEEWKPFAEMVTRMIKMADRDIIELKDLHLPENQEKLIRLQSHILTLMQIVAIPINRASSIERLRQRVLNIKTEILKKFGE